MKYKIFLLIIMIITSRKYNLIDLSALQEKRKKPNLENSSEGKKDEEKNIEKDKEKKNLEKNKNKKMKNLEEKNVKILQRVENLKENEKLKKKFFSEKNKIENFIKSLINKIF